MIQQEEFEYEAILADPDAKEEDYADSYSHIFRMKERAAQVAK